MHLGSLLLFFLLYFWFLLKKRSRAGRLNPENAFVYESSQFRIFVFGMSFQLALYLLAFTLFPPEHKWLQNKVNVYPSSSRIIRIPNSIRYMCHFFLMIYRCTDKFRRIKNPSLFHYTETNLLFSTFIRMATCSMVHFHPHSLPLSGNSEWTRFVCVPDRSSFYGPRWRANCSSLPYPNLLSSRKSIQQGVARQVSAPCTCQPPV